MINPNETDFEKARDAAVRYLSYRARSAFEMRAKLAEKGFGGEAVEQVLALLVENGYIDDVAYAAEYIAGQSKKYGKYRITQALRRRGVSDADINAAYADYGEEANTPEADVARAALMKRYGEIPTDYADKRRAWGFLMRRGFSGGVISAALGVDIEDE